MFVVLHKIRLMLELHDGLKDQGPAPHPQQTHRILRVHKHTAYKTHTYGTAHSLQAEQTDQRYTHNNTCASSEQTISFRDSNNLPSPEPTEESEINNSDSEDQIFRILIYFLNLMYIFVIKNHYKKNQIFY